MRDIHPVITMLGSSKFKDDFIRESKRLTYEGNLVIPLILYWEEDGQKASIPEIRADLDSICRQKVRLCDEVFVVNKDGYIGSSTRKSVEYAESLGKTVTFMEPDHLPSFFERFNTICPNRKED